MKCEKSVKAEPEWVGGEPQGCVRTLAGRGARGLPTVPRVLPAARTTGRIIFKAGTPHASQIQQNSTKSSLRSPCSMRATNDRSRRSFSASCLWVSPAAFRMATSVCLRTA